ncbi:MAG: NAD(P)/FAD-dependent oxidoreductase [Clostridia bacterium]|nr:NAD(P)/FAD-dependent oxidoreductase [Clostridia bacterium]
MKKIAVIGGGAAGMMAAAEAARDGNIVYLTEKNEKLGKKLYITGKGRCNITNLAPMDEFFLNIPRNPRFLYSAFDSFSNEDVVTLMNSLGVPTKLERGNRIFPVSDKSSDVIRALADRCKKRGVRILLNSEVKSIAHTEAGFDISFEKEEDMHFDAVVIATGGVTYKSTGSTGAGFNFAESLGHTIIPPKPSLVPLETKEQWITGLMGLTLKNVTLKAYRKNKLIYEELGELLITHFGISGPLVLSLSGVIADDPAGVCCKIDMKPGLTLEELDRRILRDLDKHKHKTIRNALIDLMPSRMTEYMVMLAKIADETTTDTITKAERKRLCELIKGIPLTIKCARPLDEGIITRGGVSVKEIVPSTMESKLVKGLFFAGEVIDVDGYTGGFNLQIAFSTGYLAGRSV